MNEFSIIAKYFLKESSDPSVILGSGDDAACISVPHGNNFVVTTDTLVSGVHFFPEVAPEDLALKCVAVNVSDILAMGAEPKWALLSLTLPTCDESWLSRFSQGLFAACDFYNISLVGGNLSSGPLNLSMTMHGIVPQDILIQRSGAQIGDIIYVSAPLGAPSLALDKFDELSFMDIQDHTTLLQSLLRPRPPVELLAILRKYVHCAIDISDGLSGDLLHICAASQVSALLDEASLPLHPLVIKYVESRDQRLNFALNGGDEYQLCFTVSPRHNQEFLKSINKLSYKCYPIGVMVPGFDVKMRRLQGEIVTIVDKGHKHFA
jgi:thiamine-monophosphate kinase